MRHGWIGLVAAFLMAGVSLGKTFYWGTPQTITADSDVDTNGVRVAAYTVLSSGSVVVNGVAFEAVPSVDYDVQVWGENVAFRRPAPLIAQRNPDRSLAQLPVPTETMTSNYLRLARGVVGGHMEGTALQSTSLIFQNLVAGHSYRAQFWVNDSTANGIPRLQKFTVRGYVEDGEVILRQNAAQVVGGLGQWVTLDFVAPASTIYIDTVGTVPSGGFYTGYFSAVQLRDITVLTTAQWSGGTNGVWATDAAGWSAGDGRVIGWTAESGVTNVACFTNTASIYVNTAVMSRQMVVEQNMQITGSGSLQLASDTLCVGGRCGLTVPVSTSNALIKSGRGDLHLDAVNTSAAISNLIVREGRVLLGSPTYPLAGLLYKLDASDMTALTLSSTNTVLEWRDLLSRQRIAKSSYETNFAPFYVASSFNNRGALVFGSQNAKSFLMRKSWTQNWAEGNQISDSLQTVVTVLRPLNTNAWAGVFGNYGSTFEGFRMNDWNSRWDWDSGNTFPFRFGGANNSFIYQNGLRVNSAATAQFTVGNPYVIVAQAQTNVLSSFTVGWYATDYTSRYYKGELAEVMVYNRALSDADRRAMENYLMAKWGIASSSVVSRTEGALSSAAQVQIESNATLVLNGYQQTVTKISGNGAIVNSDPAFGRSLLVVSNETDIAFDGTFSGNMQLKKAGNGTLLLSRPVNVTGTLEVTKGTLAFSLGLPRTERISLRLDASLPDTVVTNAQGEVSQWRSPLPNGAVFSQENAALRPTYQAAALNGRGAVRLGATKRTFLASSNSLAYAAQTVFVVCRAASFREYAGLFGDMTTNANYGLRLGGSGISAPVSGVTNSWAYPGTGNSELWSSGGRMYADGTLCVNIYTNVVPLNQIQVITATMNQQNEKLVFPAIGWYFVGASATYFDRYYDGEIAEIIVYRDALDEGDRRAVEEYLLAKWKGSAAAEANPLAMKTRLVLGAGSCVNLGGYAQTLQSVSGTGVITNGALTVQESVTPTGDLVLPQRFTGQIAFLPGAVTTFAGSTDLSAITFQVTWENLTENVYEIARCANGSFTGTPSIAISNPALWSVKVTATQVILRKTVGTLMLVQ